MSTDWEAIVSVSKKAMAYDLIFNIGIQSGKADTPEEIKTLIRAYIAGLSQK